MLPRRSVEIAVAGTGLIPLNAARVTRAARTVIAGENTPAASLSYTFYSSQRMRALNRGAFGKDRSTDVIAFPMQHDDVVVGDVYICPARAKDNARRHGVSQVEELLRLVVHGTLHVLGYDHPVSSSARIESEMWRRQEKYLARALGGPA